MKKVTAAIIPILIAINILGIINPGCVFAETYPYGKGDTPFGTECPYCNSKNIEVGTRVGICNNCLARWVDGIWYTEKEWGIKFDKEFKKVRIERLKSCGIELITAQVVAVYDGDTLTVELADGTRERVRLIGIDAPELRDNRHGAADAAFGPAARDYLRGLVAGATVNLVLGVKERDRYGRLLAYVYRDGLFINVEMVRAGYAVTYTVPPDVAHADEYLAAEREARAEGRGLWKSQQWENN